MREGAICWKLIGRPSKMCIIMKTLFLVDISNDLRGMFVCFTIRKCPYLHLRLGNIQMIEKQQEKQKTLEYVRSSALSEFPRNPFTG